MIVLFSRRCILPGELANASYALPTDIMNISYPFDYNTGNWSSCKLYDTNFTSSYHSSTRFANSTELKSNETRFCNQWVYDKTTIENSAVMEVNNYHMSTHILQCFIPGTILDSVQSEGLVVLQ